jgi:hypothetical protein
MTQINQNFTMIAGDTVYLSVPITDAAGAAYTITGANPIKWVLKPTPDRAAILNKTLVSGIAIDTTTSILITIAASDTATLAAGVYYHECEITLLDGSVSTPFTGWVTILATGV